MICSYICNSYKDGHCLGTKEIEPCSCKGNRIKCDFYGSIPTKKETYKMMPNAQKRAEENQKYLEQQIQRIAETICNAAKNNKTHVDMDFTFYDEILYWRDKLEDLGYTITILPYTTATGRGGMIRIDWDS